MTRVLAIFLDGYEESLAQRFMADGEMPAMTRLAASSARFVLDYGAGQRTGLAGEHVATGLSPDDAQRWSAVHFNPETYQVWQEGTRRAPFAADLAVPTVVFDVPYFDLRAAPAVEGVVAWGAHDPGVARFSRPNDLMSQIQATFGPYPAQPWIYGFTWPSAQRAQIMGQALSRAVDVRAEIAHWLLGERFPDWQLALIAVSESHSAVEALWHGVDSNHRLHGIPSTAVAATAIRDVYRAIDRLVDKLASTFPDAVTIVFAMGGMGENRSDLQSMLLFPELLYRNAFKRPLFKQPKEWAWSRDHRPISLSETDNWEGRIARGFAPPPPPLLRRVVARAVPNFVKSALRKAQPSPPPAAPQRPPPRKGPARITLNWMPATAYRKFWPAMPAFALPSFYDGRVRVNLKGREAFGIVELSDYERVLGDIARIACECIDPATGNSAVDFVEYTAPQIPGDLAETESDLVVVWKSPAAAFEHPSLGRIGPIPYRRPGGHTGASGVAYIRAADLSAGDRGTRSAYDIVPTLIEFLGRQTNGAVSGRSLLSPA